ncbi:MAG: hypothetical protein EA400_15820 [Chromatiaceae bacterium]|nr:MAG: hypothetical protein EA400_15820 [Chromatiaceae bacterium]
MPMMLRLHNVLQAALGLPVADRAALAERCPTRLDVPDEADSDGGWGAEAERRLATDRDACPD